MLLSCAPRIRGSKLVMMAKKEDDDGKSGSTKRSLVVRGQETSVRLEDTLWDELRAMADERNVSLSELLNSIDIKRKRNNLSSAIRLFVSNSRRKRR
jgi:predicted DNA-binding ribbon-helix-helix protein